VTRLTGFSKTTVSRLVLEAGQAATWYQHRVFRNLGCKRLQVDEVWGFVGAKAKNAKPVLKATGRAGDAWLWLATDADTKLVPSLFVGGRDSDSAITSDGHRAYLEAVGGAFGGDVDYAMLVKLFSESLEASKGRYMHWRSQGAGRGRSRLQARQHVLRGTEEPQRPYALAADDAADKRGRSRAGSSAG
jgi:hypothetical protein